MNVFFENLSKTMNGFLRPWNGFFIIIFVKIHQTSRDEDHPVVNVSRLQLHRRYFPLKYRKHLKIYQL